jgi:hypothetical protein
MIRRLLREALGSKSVSIEYLKGLLKNTINPAGQKVLKQWISTGGGSIELSHRQQQLLNDIKAGGPKPGMYSTKN